MTRQIITDPAKRTPRPENVRIAGRADEAQILRLMRAAFEEQPIFPLDEQKMLLEIRQATDRQGGVIGVLDGPNGLEGYLFAVISQYWYSSDSWHLSELSNFVDPKVRAGRPGHARSLIEFAKWFAEQMGIPLVMGILSTQRLEAKIRLYRRQIVPCGAIFVHNTGHIDGLLSEKG